ncbi:MAG: hypothetical protein ACHQ5A_12635 [Opitutales bacterium]
MNKILLALFFLAALPGLRAAAPVDLGQGLVYLRIHSLDKDDAALTAALAQDAALILDLRYPSRGLDTLASFREALAHHPANRPLFLLVSPGTPSDVVALLPTAPAGAVALGATGTWLPPEHSVAVEQTAEADRQAYDAAEAGQPLATLISGKIDKERYDEAALMTDFRGGNADPQPPPAPDPTKPKAAPEAPAPKPAPTDRVLQRAVHLHRALLALERHS